MAAVNAVQGVCVSGYLLKICHCVCKRIDPWHAGEENSAVAHLLKEIFIWQRQVNVDIQRLRLTVCAADRVISAHLFILKNEIL